MRMLAKYLSLLPLLAFSGCFVLIPLTEPDQQAVTLNEKLSAPRCATSNSNQDARASYGSSRGQSTPKLSRYIKVLQVGGDTERAHAAYWIGEMGSAGEPAIPALTENLNHRNHWVRRASAKALGKIGDPQAVPALASALRDPDKFVAHSAANALRKFDTSAARKALQSYRGI